MSTNESELHLFSEFLTIHLQSGSELTPEQCLELWRAKHSDPEIQENVKAIQEALDEMETGKVSIAGNELHANLRSKFSQAE